LGWGVGEAGGEEVRLRVVVSWLDGLMFDDGGGIYGVDQFIGDAWNARTEVRGLRYGIMDSILYTRYHVMSILVSF
jgi:hypothetical protein